jgi:hypothetical protein
LKGKDEGPTLGRHGCDQPRVILLACPSFADDEGRPSGLCSSPPSRTIVQTQLSAAVAMSNGGLNNSMWATIVANDGTVCAVAV